MAENIKRPNGTEDVIPRDVHKWHTVEKIARETAESFGFGEIRFPTFENTYFRFVPDFYPDYKRISSRLNDRLPEVPDE